MTDITIFNKISLLPPKIKDGLMEYIDFLFKKYSAQKKPKQPKAGCMKGTFKMQKDFKDPLDDFADYQK